MRTLVCIFLLTGFLHSTVPAQSSVTLRQKGNGNNVYLAQNGARNQVNCDEKPPVKEGNHIFITDPESRLIILQSNSSYRQSLAMFWGAVSFVDIAQSGNGNRLYLFPKSTSTGINYNLDQHGKNNKIIIGPCGNKRNLPD